MDNGVPACYQGLRDITTSSTSVRNQLPIQMWLMLSNSVPYLVIRRKTNHEYRSDGITTSS
jgi:hypothetical protein